MHKVGGWASYLATGIPNETVVSSFMPEQKPNTSGGHGTMAITPSAVDQLKTITPQFNPPAAGAPTTVVNQTINNTEHTQTSLGDSKATNNSGETRTKTGGAGGGW
jgi:hypothetical protein